MHIFLPLLFPFIWLIYPFIFWSIFVYFRKPWTVLSRIPLVNFLRCIKKEASKQQNKNKTKKEHETATATADVNENKIIFWKSFGSCTKLNDFCLNCELCLQFFRFYSLMLLLLLFFATNKPALQAYSVFIRLNTKWESRWKSAAGALCIQIKPSALSLSITWDSFNTYSSNNQLKRLKIHSSGVNRFPPGVLIGLF